MSHQLIYVTELTQQSLDYWGYDDARPLVMAVFMEREELLGHYNVILAGYLLDGIARNIEMPPDRAADLQRKCEPS
jgi:hypothetical protein